jgi:molecular chaperone GrpE
VSDKKKKHGNPTKPAAGDPAQGQAAPQSQQPAPEGGDLTENQEPQEVMISMTMQEYDDLQKSLEETKSKNQDYYDGWMRERADFTNYKRRVERDQVFNQQSLTASIVKKYLVILDDLERALKMRPTEGDGAAWAGGMELISRKLQAILEAEGVTRISAETETFDPNRHEAITHEDSPDHESGQIIEVVQQGYMIGDRVIRPAMVRVAR